MEVLFWVSNGILLILLMREEKDAEAEAEEEEEATETEDTKAELFEKTEAGLVTSPE